MQSTTPTSLDQHIVGHDDAVSPEQSFEALYQNLRTVRHAINNNVAVIMAMAELSQRNPAQSAKLCQLCLEKAPQIAAAIAGFSELYDGALQAQRNHAANQ